MNSIFDDENSSENKLNLFDDDKVSSPVSKLNNNKTGVGIVLIIIGAYFIIDFSYLNSFGFSFGFLFEYAAPFLFITAGIIIQKKFRKKNSSNDDVKIKSLVRLNKGKRIAGVCTGLSEYLNVDVNIIRMLFIFFTFATFGVGLVVYILFYLSVPQKPEFDVE